MLHRLFLQFFRKVPPATKREKPRGEGNEGLFRLHFTASPPSVLSVGLRACFTASSAEWSRPSDVKGEGGPASILPWGAETFQNAGVSDAFDGRQRYRLETETCLLKFIEENTTMTQLIT
jgi:hypothetical protein